MNEKQYLRANKRVFLAVTIIFSYITLTMLAALAASHGDHFVRIMIQCLVSVGVIILSALGYLTRKKTHTCAIILTTAMMVGYAAVAYCIVMSSALCHPSMSFRCSQLAVPAA